VSFCKLQDHAGGLRATAVEDRAGGADASALADKVAYAADDAIGWLAEAGEAASTAARAVSGEADLNSARRALSECQERFHRFVSSFQRLNSYEQLTQLARLSRERKRQWKGWVDSFRKGLRSCQEPMDEVTNALFRCWQEIAERAGTNNVSVRSTNIGQKIVQKPRRRRSVSAHEGVT
jgi:hypothetical protein